MMNKANISMLKYLAAFGVLATLAACSDDDAAVLFDPSVEPSNAQVVSGDSGTTEVQNTISWSPVPGATSYVVYWSNTPDVNETTSSVVDPAELVPNGVVHAGVEVDADNAYYYRVQARTDTQASELSDVVTGTPQVSTTTSPLNDVAWNGTNLLVAVGDSGTIVNSADAVNSAWSAPLDSDGVTASLSAVTWSGTEFLIVGASDTVLSSPDGTNWTSSTTGEAGDLTDVAWLVNQYVAIGNGTVITSVDGSSWTSQTVPTGLENTALRGIAGNGSRIVVVGASGTIIYSDNDGVNWIATTPLVNNELADVTWNGIEFVAVGSNDTVLVSDDGASWERFNPGTSNTDYEAVATGDVSVPDEPVLGAVGSSGDFVVTDTVEVLEISTGTDEKLIGITWVDDDVNPGYFVMVGNGGTILTAQE